MIVSAPRRFGLVAAGLALAVTLLVGLFVWAAPAQAAQGSWGRAWGKGVNGGSSFGICTVAASCRAGSAGGRGGPMNGPYGVATDAAGDVYVVDSGNNRIQEFDSSGNWLRAFGADVGGSGVDVCTIAASCQAGSRGSLGGEMSSPVGVATDAAGNVYVADTFNNRIEEFDSSGNWLRAFGADVGGSGVDVCTVAATCQAGSTGGLGGEMSGPVGVATDAAGDVYVADNSNNRIQEFDSSGNWLRAFGADVGGSGVDICTVAASCQAGTSGGLGGEMTNPYGVATDAAGNVYVADNPLNRIQKFDSKGNWLRAWGEEVNGGSKFGICTVAASCQPGSFGGLGGQMGDPAGVATDAAGNVYVADSANNRIQKFQDPYQPDAQIKLAGDTTYLGVGIVNTTGAGQTRSTTTAPGTSAAFDLKFVNAGTHSGAIAVKGCKSSTGFTVQYLKGTTDVTTGVTAGTYKTATLAAGTSQVLKLKIAVSPSATAGQIETCAVSGSSATASNSKDVVKAKVTVG